MASTADICPAQSNGTVRCGDGSVQASSPRATAPTGKLMPKISRQLTRLNSPPSTGPEQEATEAPMAHTATARARRVGSA
jgi:hypothetical protein